MVQRPHAKGNLSDDLLFCNTPYSCIAGIYGYAPVVSHNEELGFRHLIRERNITVTQRRRFSQIRFLDPAIIYIYIAVCICIGANEEIVEYAIRENEWRTTLRPVDVENKLKEWFDAGVMTIDKAMVYENERHKENKAAATKRKGRTNVRRSGKEAGITVEEPEKNEDGQAPENGAEEAPMHDSILDMFQGDDDEDN